MFILYRNVFAELFYKMVKFIEYFMRLYIFMYFVESYIYVSYIYLLLIINKNNNKIAGVCIVNLISPILETELQCFLVPPPVFLYKLNP